MKVCIIGSFRKFYDEIVAVIHEFEQAGIEVSSPKASCVINPGADFVILASDNKELTPEQIQIKVFENERESDFVYVWNPGGYLGQTTCYEIGRIQADNKPIYFKEKPNGIIITGVKDEHIMSVKDLIEKYT